MKIYKVPRIKRKLIIWKILLMRKLNLVFVISNGSFCLTYFVVAFLKQTVLKNAVS